MTTAGLELPQPRPPEGGSKDSAALGSGGKNEFGTISFRDSVVAKIASQAAVEVADAGGAAPRLLGRSLAGAAALGVRKTSLDALPKAAARVDGATAVIDLEISVRWPASVPETASAVRGRVIDKVGELTGLHVIEVAIAVTDLVTELAPPPRVR
jgi:uncharacterized alkaline shock family protein YloU